MCTIVALHRVHPTLPLLVLANRDEFYARRASGPTLLSESPRAAGGRDLERGGSWFGVSERGFFVGLTNQRQGGPKEPELRSRGEVVTALLGSESRAEVVAKLQALDAREYNPFNVLVGDAEALDVAYARREARSVAIESLAPGTWILPNDRIGSPEFPKTGRAETLAHPLLAATIEDLPRLARALLGDHTMPALEAIAEPPPGAWLSRDMLRALQAICIHTPVYGTRSASVVALGADGKVERYLFADGPPCTTDLVDCTSLVRGARAR
jgi:uncharacterized protein with NRDE domain